ncbi:INO80 complex subunit D-like protein, partial [Drosera capensis]
MASSSSPSLTKPHLPPPPPPPPPTTAAQFQFPKPTSKPATTLSPPMEDACLSNSTPLPRQELLRRRLHRLRQLSRVYRDHYWALMDDLRVLHREYYWKYGLSPYKVVGDQEREGMVNGNGVEGSGETGRLGLGFGERRCGFVGCKVKAMALTGFCHLHILSDPNQKLYKPCNYVIKSAQAGPITCGKPILRSMVPSLCNVHFLKAQKHVTRALRKAGLNVASASKLAPKFHVIVAEYVRQIQARRRAAQKSNFLSHVQMGHIE